MAERWNVGTATARPDRLPRQKMKDVVDPSAARPHAQARDSMNEALLKAHLKRSSCECPSCGARCGPTGEELRNHPLFLCERCGLRSALGAFGLAVDYDEVYENDLYSDQTVESMRIAEQEGCDASRIPTYGPFFRVLRPTPGRNRLLDVGCGAGRFCRAAAHRGWRTLGIDLSEVALERARAMEPLEYRRVGLADIPASCGRFDVITAFEVLEHQARVREFLREVRGALNEQGRFLCTVPAWEHPDVRNATRTDWVPPVHLLFFTRSSLKMTLALNGFDVLKTGYIWMVPRNLLSRAKWLGKLLLTSTERPLGIWALARS
jgi:SAM-dependent methyltransferase